MGLRYKNFKIDIQNPRQMYKIMKDVKHNKIGLYNLGGGLLRIRDRRSVEEKISLQVKGYIVQDGMLESYGANISSDGTYCAAFFYARSGDMGQYSLLKLPLEALTERFGTINVFQGITMHRKHWRGANPIGVYPEMTLIQVYKDNDSYDTKLLYSIRANDDGKVFIGAGVSERNTVFSEEDVPMSPMISLRKYNHFLDSLREFADVIEMTLNGIYEVNGWGPLCPTKWAWKIDSTTRRKFLEE